MRNCFLFLGLLLLSVALVHAAPGESTGVRLVLSTKEIAPTTTFELRFDEPMVAYDRVGIAAPRSPLVFVPPLPGAFVWLSQRSGVFTPTAPPSLGGTYRLSLAPDLKQADGQPSPAQLIAEVQTPPMALTKTEPSSFRETNAPSSPKLVAQFNVRVDPAALTPFVEFRNAGGQTVPALLGPATEDDGYFSGEESELQAWRDRFPKPPEATPSPNDSKKPAPIPNRVVVRPAHPLPLGEGWHCIFHKGVPAADGPEHLPEDYDVTIGNVVPFAVAEVEAHNEVEDGKWLRINFSKRISPLLRPDDLARRISLTPAPANLRYETSDSSVEIHGDFQLPQRYQLEVHAAFPAEEPFHLEASFQKEVDFTPLPPRLYFPALSTAQLSGGRRAFELRVVNLPSAQVRARLLDRNSIVFALAGYKSGYAKNSGAKDAAIEPYRGVSFDLVPGPTVFDKTIDTSAPRDQAKKVALSWDELLGGRRAGAVFLAANRPNESWEEQPPTLGAQALVQLTDIGLVWKCTKTDAWIYAFSHETAKPLAGATIRLLSQDNQTLLTRKTDARGLAEFPRTERSAWLIAEMSDDFHAIEFGRQPNDIVPLYAFHVPMNFWEDPARTQRDIFLFADRPVYGPGETVQVKGMVRDRTPDGLVFPAATAAQLRITNPDEERVWEKEITLSPDGSFAEAIPLPRGRLGGYSAVLDFGGGLSKSIGFRFEEYQANAFEVSLTGKDSYAAEEVVKVKAAAHYFMGAPLAGRALRWSLEASDSNFSPAGFSQFTFNPGGEGGEEEAEGATVFQAQGETKLGADGTVALSPEVPLNPARPQPRQCSLLVEITDLGQQTISERQKFVRQSSDFYLGLQQLDHVVVLKKPLPINLAAVRADGMPLGKTVTAKVTVEECNYHVVRELGAGGAPVYRTEATYAPVFEQAVASLPLEKSGSEWAFAAPSAVQFTPNEVGTYRLRASAQDEHGHPVQTASTFSVAAEEPHRTVWDYQNEAQIDLVADKSSYAPGEQAAILLKTPISGEALVTVEQEKVRRAFIVHLQGNAPLVHVPIAASDAPNVFVSVLELRGRAQSPRQIKTPDYRIGYLQLNVVRPEDKLAVAIAPSAPDYRPGAEITSTVTVKTSAGQPAAGAEITLYAVDEGALSLMGYTTPDPFAFFYQAQPLRVQTGLSLPSLFPEDASALSYSNKGFLVGGGGDEASGQATRRNFLATAFWKADLKSAADGKASVHFPAPDNLTRFRLIAVASSGLERFGSAESQFEINKPLMLEPALPRFGNVGDKIQVRAVLHNRSTLAGEAEISLQLDDKTRERGPLVRRLTIAAGVSATVDFPVEFQNAGEAKWTWKARLEAEADAVESKLPVGFAAPLLHEILLGRVEARTANLLADANPQSLEGEGKFEVRVANTRLSGLAEAVNYLLEYPYGCAEQTVSNMLPWIVAPELGRALPELRAPKEKAQHAIDLGIDRLLTMQTVNGGLSFWPNKHEPMLWASAYGGVALALAERAGYAVPASTLDHLGAYLREQLSNSADLQSNAELSDRCLALYALALAGKPENSYHELFFNKRAQLSAESRALLALAILESHGPAEMVEELINPQTPMEPQGDLFFGSGTRELAVRLLAWSQFRPADHAVDVLAEELLHARRQGRWENTQSNAWAILGLTKYAAEVETGEKQAAGTLAYETSRSPFQLDEKTHVFAEEHPIAAASPGATPAPLTLANPDARLLFTEVKMEARPRVALQPRQDRGFRLERAYQKINDDGSFSDTGALRVGDRILVTLHLEARQPAHYVAVDDALPAIFEALNPEFKTQATRAGEALSSNWNGDYQELRHDRALFFQNHLPPGNYTIRYLARVRAAGAATAPAARIEEMYHPEHFGLSEAILLKSAPLE